MTTVSPYGGLCQGKNLIGTCPADIFLTIAYIRILLSPTLQRRLRDLTKDICNDKRIGISDQHFLRGIYMVGKYMYLYPSQRIN